MSDIVDRKSEHLRLCLEEVVESGAASGFDAWRLAYRALPEIALEDVDLSVELAGKTLAAPLIIGAMSGGTTEAMQLNRTLAEAAALRGVGLALGSGRVLLERPETAPTFQVREVAPDILLFANLGAVQLNLGVGAAEVARMVELVGADALNLHLNPLQEAIQPSGDTDFRGLADKIGALAEALDVPVFVKEVGAGIGPETAELLAELPIAGVETAGVGGTSWSRVEALRAPDAIARSTGIALGGFGVPTVESLLACRAAMGERPVIASGGVRTAIHVATALALGADAAAFALPFLRAAQGGSEAVVAVIDHMVETLRVISFVCGAAAPRELRGRAQRVDGK